MDTNVGCSGPLKLLLKKTTAFDKQKKYVYFDRIWQNTENLKQCAEIIYNHIRSLENDQKYGFLKNREKLVLLSPDRVGGSFGILPISFFVADKLGCQVAVWRELADMKWGTSDIVGHIEQYLNCIVLQDVVDQGTTALKIAHTINELNLKWKIELYLATVLNDSLNDKNSVTNTLSRMEDILGNISNFEFIIRTSELFGE